MIVVLLLGLAEILYGILLIFDIATPYSVKTSSNRTTRKRWCIFYGTSKICWGLAITFFVFWVSNTCIMWLIMIFVAVVAALIFAFSAISAKC